jgi:ubiquinone/menaquinone biosynthesis C-methylase UbiE
MDLSKLSIEETLSQCSKPIGDIGREVGKRMNKHHKPLIIWGLAFLFENKKRRGLKILDVGCGAGLAMNLISKIVPDAKINGIDYSDEMVEAATIYNKKLIESKKVTIKKGSVDKLQFKDNMFDIVIATETIYFWPSLLENVKEVYRTLKNNGSFAIINEDYDAKVNNSNSHTIAMIDSDKVNLLNKSEHLKLFKNAGFKDIRVSTIPSKGWIIVCGIK